jgi:enoyl-CoA hydratase
MRGSFMQHILFEIKNHTGFITLNRPGALNALTLEMIRTLHQQLKIWAVNDSVHQVTITSNHDKAFCAGGDIRAVHEAGLQGKKNTLAQYFKEEYALNTYIKNYPKPYIAILNGIAMGGGLGISLHGSLRIAFNNLILSMPETTIGYFPDVGATWFLSRCKNNIGIYMGLSSARLNATEALYAELIDQIIGAPPIENHLKTHLDTITRCFQYATVEEILAALQTEKTPWATHLHDSLLKKSPTSLKFTLAALQKAKTLDFEACMHMEYHLACIFTMGHDFYEGIRAAVIDKDQKPQWHPATLSEIEMPITF